MTHLYENPNKTHYGGPSELEAERKVFHCSGILKRYVHGKVLDVGAGQGHITDALVDDNPKVKEIICLEVSDYNLRILKRKGYSVKKADLDTYPYLKKTDFDTVISSDVIEHLLSPYCHLVECHRLLKPGGALIISTPQASRTKVTVPHLYYFTPRSLEMMLRRAGFESIMRIYNGILSPGLTRLTSRVPIVRNVLNKGCYYVARK